jgi:hypothetical protein
MEDHDDFAFEPIPGLPEQLPRGETLLWQGSPQWRALAISAFHVRKVAAYFCIILAWQAASAYSDGEAATTILLSALRLAGIGMIAIGILCALAFLYARGTIYTLTSKRIVIRSGLALPVTLNLPLAMIETAALTKQSGSVGSIAMTVAKPNRVAFLVLWPNARPGYLTNPQPMLRCLDDAGHLAGLLAKALQEDGGAAGRMPARTAKPADASGAPVPSGATFAA